MKKAPVVVSFLLLLLVMAACLLPENFVATMDVEKGGKFSFSYDGTLIFLPFKMGKPSQRDVRQLREELLRDPAFKKVKYLGDARYQVEYKKNSRLEKPYFFYTKDMALIEMFPWKKDGKKYAVIRGKQVSAEELQQLHGVNVKVDGTLEVKTNGKVIEHNATETPKLWGLFGGYKWHIKSPSAPRPFILIELD